jgi:SAM-dependent methyltransferase
MDAEVSRRLLEINRRFYSEFGAAFAATRRRIQPGVRRALDLLPDAAGERWLDLGCGGGALAREWLRRRRLSSYLGLDFSAPLLAEASQVVAGAGGSERVAFAQADLSNPGWATGLNGGFRGALAFAVLHHLPGKANRERLLRQVHGLLVPRGMFVHSVWQFQRSPKLLSRVQPWDLAGLREEQLEPGDTLLDWRYTLPTQTEQAGLRYVHTFTPAELEDLAAASGFAIRETYESDGQGGRLGLYQVWEALPTSPAPQP